MKHHHTSINEPNIGQATICLWRPLSKREVQAKKQNKVKKLRAEGVTEEDFELAMLDSDEEMDDWEFYDLDPLDDVVMQTQTVTLKTSTPVQPFVIPADVALIPFRYPTCPPSDAIGRVSLLTEVQYSGFIYVDQETSILCANTTYVPSLPSSENSTVYVDGYWGRKEPSLYVQRFDPHAPWLLYSTISHDVLHRPLLYGNQHNLWTEGLRMNPLALPSLHPSADDTNTVDVSSREHHTRSS